MYSEGKKALNFPENVELLQINNMFIKEKENSYCLFIEMNKAMHGSLQEQIRKIGNLDFLTFFPIFRDTILGLCFLHTNNIAHRDIKPSNTKMLIPMNRYPL